MLACDVVTERGCRASFPRSVVSRNTSNQGVAAQGICSTYATPKAPLCPIID